MVTDRPAADEFLANRLRKLRAAMAKERIPRFS